jgi:hypothetical protein
MDAVGYALVTIGYAVTLFSIGGGLSVLVDRR